jgi:hypothetical protein
LVWSGLAASVDNGNAANGESDAVLMNCLREDFGSMVAICW